MANRTVQVNSRKGEQLVEWIAADPAGTLLATDFDGVLAPIVPDPADSRMLAASGDALRRLAGLVGHVAVITGREVRTVVELGRLDDVFQGRDNVVALGQYGVERWDAATGEVDEPPTPPEVRQAIERIHQHIDEGSPDLAGVAIEDKGRAVGVHFRRAKDSLAAANALTPFLEELGDELGLVVEPGRDVVELRSSTMTKGEALRELAASVQAKVVVMFGDDLGDLSAFEVAQSFERGGAVASSSDEQPRVAEAADVVVDGPDGVADWLTALADRLEGSLR